MDGLEHLLRHLVERESDKDEKLNRAEHLKLIEEFRSLDAANHIQDGDFVERNVYGIKRYKYPADGQVAACHKKLDKLILDNEGNACDMQMIVSFAKGKLLVFPVQSAYYQKAEEKKNIFPLFRGKPN